MPLFRNSDKNKQSNNKASAKASAKSSAKSSAKASAKSSAKASAKAPPKTSQTASNTSPKQTTKRSATAKSSKVASSPPRSPRTSLAAPASSLSYASNDSQPLPPPISTKPADAPAQLTEEVRNELSRALQSQNTAVVESLLKQNPTAARSAYHYRNADETLLSMALLQQASLSCIQAIYRANPTAITQGNSNRMSALHQAVAVPTTAEVMIFLVTELRRHDVKLVQLTAPGGWSVIHTACRCGLLPTDTFQYILEKSKTMLARTTESTLSTPLHLAMYGLEHRTVPEQRVMVQHLVQSYPYAVNAKNKDGNTPVEIAVYKARKGLLANDMVDLLLDVRELVQRKYNTRYHVEQAITRCQAKLDSITNNTATALPQDMDSGSRGSASHGGSVGGSNEKKTAKSSAVDQKKALRQGTLAHIEMQMLVPLRKKFQSEEELQTLIDQKSQDRERLSKMGPKFYAETMALNEEIIALEVKLKREQDALVPQEIQATRHALYERIRAESHLLPINNVSLEWLNMCTNKFSEQNQIGKGGFGAVFRAYDPVKCCQYAVKKTDKFDDPSLLREVEILAGVYHPNVIKLLGFYVPPEGRAPQYLVYEYAAGGTIVDRLSSKENRETLTWNIRLSAAVGVASGLDYLHNGLEHTILHHDVKPENVVFTETLDRAILIDCGISKVIHGDMSFKQTMAGTPFYLPSSYSEQTPYDEKCEVFSYGMVLKVLLSGKVPKSLNDRTRVFEPDKLAGKWPDTVLPDLTKLMHRCVSEDENERPTINEMHQTLTDLENLAEEKTELTPQQEETINETLTQSRLVSRASRSLESFGKCFCSRSKKKGLYCPGKVHFQCSECFNKYVLDHLGEEIVCREVCSCAEAYTLDELHHHVRRSVLCRHVETLMKNRELQVYKDANGRMMDEIGRGFDRVMRGVTNLAKDELKCPLLALLVPSQTHANRSMVRRALRSWKTSTKRTFFLYFMDAYDNSVVQAPIKVDATRDWVKAAAPFLRAVLCGLQIAVMTIGLPISIPMIEEPKNQSGDQVASNIQILDQMLVDIAGPDEAMQREMSQVLQSMQGGGSQGGRMSSHSYRLVAELANQAGNTRWREMMVLAERNGELAWVLKHNEARWKRGDSDSFEV